MNSFTDGTYLYRNYHEFGFWAEKEKSMEIWLLGAFNNFDWLLCFGCFHCFYEFELYKHPEELNIMYVYKVGTLMGKDVFNDDLKLHF